MRIEAIDAIRATDDNGRDLILEPGDVISVGPNFGALACQKGWARDADGVVPTGEKTFDPVTVNAQNVVVTQRSK